MNPILNDRSFKLTILLTLIYLGVGFAFLHYGLADYGWILFILLPFSLGVAIGAMPFKKWALIGMFFTVLAFLAFLYLNALEGMICVVMSIPVIIPLVILGVWANKALIALGVFKPTNNLKILIVPLIIVLFGAPIEKYLNSGNVEIVEVKTERIYPYSPDQVYDAIKSVDTLIAEKPFLMKFDLPIPEKCVLEKEAVGGIRTCYFSGGKIIEKITELERGKVLRMDVIDYQLTGRTWLGFKEAIYYFDKVGETHCKLTRITTYTSVLNPRFYWEPLEKLGIRQEHDYVFDNLSNDLKQQYGR